MFAVTETAGIRLVEKLAKRATDDDSVMRFVRKSRGWLLRLDKPATDDSVFEHEGQTVLVVDAKAARLLVDRTLDTKDSSAGSKLCLR
jgi:Fe-S cluster assembly iron-binding protein IscA